MSRFPAPLRALLGKAAVAVSGAAVAGAVLSAVVGGCALPPEPSYRVDATATRPWNPPAVADSCPMRDEAEARFHARSGLTEVVWARDGNGLVLLRMTAADLEDLVLQRWSWAMREALLTDPCVPGSRNVLRLVLSNQSGSTDSVQFDLDDGAVEEWRQMIASGDSDWDLVAIDGKAPEVVFAPLMDSLRTAWPASEPSHASREPSHETREAKFRRHAESLRGGWILDFVARASGDSVLTFAVKVATGRIVASGRRPRVLP